MESREASLEEAETLDLPVEEPKPVAVVEGVRELDDAGIDRLIKDMGLAMSHDDLAMIREYFRTEESAIRQSLRSVYLILTGPITAVIPRFPRNLPK